MRKLKKSEYVLAGILALVVAFPLAVGPIPFPDVPVQGAVVATTEAQNALNNYTNYRQDRRDYQHAMQICIQLRAQDQTVTCPGINDYDAIHRFLNGDYSATLHAAASATTLRISDLTSYQQGLIRWYQRIHSCPDSIKDYYLAGFYNLCESMVQNAAAVDPTQNLHQGVTGDQAPTTLNQIINANQAPTRK